MFCLVELASDDERLEVGLGSGGARTVYWGLSAVGLAPVYESQ